MAALTFSHMGIACKDPLAIEHFYTKYFEFKRTRIIPLEGTQIVFLRSGDAYLELFQAREHVPIPPVRMGRGILAGVTSLFR